MPVEYYCAYCGYVLYRERKNVLSLETVLRKYCYTCPCCLSPFRVKATLMIEKIKKSL